MNKEERHQLILSELNKNGKVFVTDLAKSYQVTPETIRRDFEELALSGQLSRIHGGAVPYSPVEPEMVYEKKLSVHLDEKIKVAKRAAEMIQNNDTIAIDVGTTTVHIADMLSSVTGLTVVTNSLSAANRFNLAIEEGRMTGQVIMLPGVTNPYQSSVKGTYTVEFLKRFNFTKAFISCGGVTKEAVYDFDIDESLVSEVMIECSCEAILLTDSSKLNKKSVFEISPLSNISAVICDQNKPSDWPENGYGWVTAGAEAEPEKGEKHESRLPRTS